MTHPDPGPPRTLVLIAGASGSGKSRLATLAERPQLSLDDFYRDGDEPGLPRTLGIVDWDDVDSWRVEEAVEAVAELIASGIAAVPVYSIADNARLGQRPLDVRGSGCFLAEGVFALDLLGPLQARGLPVLAIWLDRPRTLTALRRLRRDLAERRKPPAILLRRGFALWRAEPALRRRALGLGFRPMSLRRALGRIRGER